MAASKIFPIIAVTTLLLISCVESQIASFAGSDPSARARYHRIIPYLQSEDLVQRKVLETGITVNLQNSGVKSSPSLDAVKPTEKMTDAIMKKAAEDVKCDAWLMVKIVSDRSGMYVTRELFSDDITSIPVRDFTFTCELYDTVEWKCVWTCSIQSNGVDDFQTIVDHVARQIVEAMKKDGVI